jgi:cytochrome b561
MLALGWAMVNIVDDPGERFDLYQAHKSLGLFILALTLARIGLRLARGTPPPIATIPRWRRRAAGMAHVLLYVLTIALILAGYAMVSASPLPLPVALPFGLTAPNLLAPDYELSERFKQIHHVLAAILAICLAGHAAAAVKHRFVDRDDTLRRIGLSRR